MVRITLALLFSALPVVLLAQGSPEAIKPSFQARYWLTDAAPEVRSGAGLVEGGLDFGQDLSRRNRGSREFLFGVPTGDGNRLMFSFFSTSNTGKGDIDRTFEFFGQSFDIDSALEAKYSIRSFRASWDFLSWPAGATENDRFRFKTLWELQYLRVGGEVSTLDLETPIRSSQSKSLILPTFGVGFDWRPLKKLECNARISGFGVFNGGRVWNGEALCAWHVRGVHAMFGVRQFSASTARDSDQFFNIRMSGPMFGLERRF